MIIYGDYRMKTTVYRMLLLAAFILILAVSSTSPAYAVEGSIQVPDPNDWIDYGTILSAGDVGEWDHILWGGFAASVIKKGNLYYLYYQGSEFYQGAPDHTVMWRAIGVAVSSDGINFKKHTGNPVLTWFPNKYGEEGAVSSGVTLDKDNNVVLYYGANRQESATTVNADGRVAVSKDGLSFSDRGVVLDGKSPTVWGSGDEIFPVGAIFDRGRWIVYYIPNGVPQSGQLGVAYGDQFNKLTHSEQVKSDGQPVHVWGTTGHAKISDGKYAVILNNLRQNRTEVRILSTDQPGMLSPPVVTYPIGKNQEAILLLDQGKNTWFMYYRSEEEFGVKLAPAGERDTSPPTAPQGLKARSVGSEQVELSWQPAADPDTGIVHYLVYRDGELIGTARGQSFRDTAQTGVDHAYQVAAVNLHGTQGPLSAPVHYGVANIQPEYGSTALVRRPLFQWAEVPGAVSYQVQIATNSNFGKVLISQTRSTPSLTPTKDLPLNKTIYWRVRAKVNDAYQPWSMHYSFLSANPPSNPNLRAPANNALTTHYVPKLRWSQSSLPSNTTFKEYQLQVARDKGFTDLVFERLLPNRTAPSYTVLAGELLPNSTYYWRVRSSNTLGHTSNWSRPFKLRAAMLPATLTAPAEASSAVTPRPQFEWSAIEGANNYAIQISLKANFSELLISARQAETVYIPTKNLPRNRTMYWRVRGNGVNGPSLWTKGWFTSANAPSTPALVSPANNALNINLLPRLSWRASALPSGTTFLHYRLQVAADSGFSQNLQEILIPTRTTPFYRFQEGEKLNPDTRYYWRVQAWNTAGHYSTWSAVRSFRTAMAR
jgi:hypothetical protein